MKVLLFSNDLMPFGNLPTSGGGLRCYQIMKGLESQGVDVIASMPGFTYLAKKHFAEIPEVQREFLWEFGKQDQILNSVKPDAVIFSSNWDHYNLTRKPSIPLIVDLHGSRLIETSMWGQRASADKKVEILSLADCLTTAGEKQRLYFYGWLVQAGRVPEAKHFIRYIPISLSPDLPVHQYLEQVNSSPIFVSGGGWFPWQNQAKAIFAVAKAVQEKQRGQIEIYGTPHERIGMTSEEQLIFQIYDQVKKLSQESPRIKLGGYIGRQDLIDLYTKSSVAVEAMTYNLERELAFTTRTIEYLWCGLPVIYNNYSEISAHIREFDAGWTIDPSSDVEISQVIEEIFDSPDLVRKKSENAQKLVRERFTWDKTITPLLEFLKNPQIAPLVQPTKGTVYARPSFLRPRGPTVEIPFDSSATIEQKFILPAENIFSIELPYAFTNQNSKTDFEYLELELTTKQGRLIRKHKINSTALANFGELSIKLPSIREIKGGTEVKLALKLVGPPTKNPPILLKALSVSTYPFLNSANSTRALALSFTPSEFAKIYKIKVYAGRAVRMIQEGEWKRLAHAVKRRVPIITHKIKKATFGRLEGNR